MPCSSAFICWMPEGRLRNFARRPQALSPRLQMRVDGLSPYAANLCPIRWGGAMSHTRLRMTILYSEDGGSKDYFAEPPRQPRERPSRRRFRVSLGKTLRRKRRNASPPSHPYPSVPLPTSNSTSSPSTPPL